MTKYVLALVTLLVALCVLAALAIQSHPASCQETACRPDWSGDCYCSRGQTMERQPDGVVICRCPAGSP